MKQLLKRVFGSRNRMYAVIGSIIVVSTILALVVISVVRTDWVLLALVGALCGGILVRRMRHHPTRRRRKVLAKAGKPVRRAAIKLRKSLVNRRVMGILETRSPMAAVAFIRRRNAWNLLAPGTARVVSRELRKRGYLADGRRLLSDVVAATDNESDTAMLERVDGQIDLLTLQNLPSLPSRPIERPERNRVLHVVKHSLLDTQSGYTLRTQKIAAAQARAGLDPHVVNHLGLSTKPVPKGGIVRDGVTYHSLPVSSDGVGAGGEWFERHVEALSELVHELRPAVLHAASDYVNAFAARIVGDSYGIPVVYEFRGFWEETLLSSLAREFGWDDLDSIDRSFGLPDSYRWRQVSEARARKSADALVTLAPIMADHVSSSPEERSAISIVPNAIDPDDFFPIPPDRDLLKELGFSRRATVFGYVTSLSEYEGIDVLIRAFAELRSRVPSGSVALLIVGDGKQMNQLRELVGSVGGEGIVLTGRVPHDDVVRYYSVIDVFVVPRLPATVCRLVTPLKPYEAFALEKTVVMSDVEALAGIAEESGGAVLFPAGDVSALAATLQGLFEDPERRRELARRGREWVITERTWDTNAETYRALYRRLSAAVT